MERARSLWKAFSCSSSHRIRPPAGTGTCTTGPLRALLWPGFLCQKITTIEPDDDQLEVALASLRVTLFREKGEDVKAGGDVRYASFDALMNSPHLRRAA